jgi:hypothetical protein
VAVQQADPTEHQDETVEMKLDPSDAGKRSEGADRDAADRTDRSDRD